MAAGLVGGLTACSTPTPGPQRPADGCGETVDAADQTAFPTPKAAAKAYVDVEVRSYRDRLGGGGPVGGVPTGQTWTGGPVRPTTSSKTSTSTKPAAPTTGTDDKAGATGDAAAGSRAAEALGAAASAAAQPQDVLVGILQRAISDKELVVRGQVTSVEMYAADSRDSGSVWATQGPDGWRVVGTTYPCEAETSTP